MDYIVTTQFIITAKNNKELLKKLTNIKANAVKKHDNNLIIKSACEKKTGKEVEDVICI